MKTSVYPIPCGEGSIEEVVDPFLEAEINQRAFSKDDLFMILLLNPSTSEYEGTNKNADYKDIVTTHIKSKESRIRIAYELDKLTVALLDERRLSNFAISLLYNVLEQNPVADPTSVMTDEQNLTDEDIRKVDYYLPKINDQVQDLITEQQQEFENQMSSLLPVSPNNKIASNLYRRLSDNIQSDGAIIDYLILTAAADEDREGVQSLLGSIRNIDLEKKLLSGDYTSNISGYQRIIQNSYNKKQSEFFDDFETGIDLYRDSTTSAELLRILRELDSDISINSEQNQSRSAYQYEPTLTQLLTAQIDGNNQIIKWILQAVNIIRLIQDNERSVLDSYQTQHTELESTLDEIDENFNRIDELQENYPKGKISYDDTTIDHAREMIREVKQSNSLLIKFIFGYDMDFRTSAYTTAQTRLRDTKSRIDNGIGKLRNQTIEINKLQTSLENELDTIDQSYEDIERTSVVVDIPERDDIKRVFQDEWLSEIESLKRELPMLDFGSQSEDIRRTQQEDWQQVIAETRNELQSLRAFADDLSKFSDQINQIENIRDNTRQEFQQIHDKIQ
ncbi:hypothetical protein [Haloquadratum walsbyi]|uniref:Uncharacterized protein n=1 Tax=Haloquadratum walsbyi (strain DSM 16854 / JCM 12705 / C23) TaxID=768065 RepID=G0LN92_HALWC|nr:hypothetical protein [Haloquadratum walsbyi]CCC41898.1 uncharacterized protein Hqrw_5022 [Haloquadratum walsbyi C23]